VVDGPVIGAGRDIDDAAFLVGRDADDAGVLPGDAIVLGLAGLRVVADDVPAGVVGALLALLGIALLRADPDGPAGPDVVARVNLALGREPLGVAADDLVRIHYHLHRSGLRVELDEIGIHAVLRRADVEPAVVALDDGEVAALLVGVLGGQLVGMAAEPVSG